MPCCLPSRGGSSACTPTASPGTPTGHPNHLLKPTSNVNLLVLPFSCRLVCTLFRFNAVPSPSLLSEALSCLGSKLNYIRPAFYSGVLHSLLSMHVPIPPALPAAIHTALRQPNLQLSPHDVTNLLNTALRTFDRVSPEKTMG